MSTDNLKLDERFEKLLPPLTGEQRSGLEADMLSRGCLMPLVVWNGLLIDGYHRHAICRKHGIEFSIRILDFDSVVEVCHWLVESHKNRRNLSSFALVEAVLPLKPMIAEQAKQHQREAGGAVPARLPGPPIETREELAKIAGVSARTLDKAEAIAEKAPEDIKARLRAGDTNVNKEYKKLVSRERELATRERGSIDLPAGKFAVIYADPPWQYDAPQSDSRAIENHYPTMTVDDIETMGVADISASDSILFLWATSPKLTEALGVLSKWGFQYKTSMVWVKDKIGMGWYCRQKHELLLIGVRGSPGVPVPEDRPPSVIEAPRGRHSEKPEVVYELIERMYPNHAKCELFARRKREGWIAWGNEVE